MIYSEREKIYRKNINIDKGEKKKMNKKLNMVLLVILTASLMISTASASNLDDHKVGNGKMAHPTSSAGVEVCKGCHGDLGSATAPGFCTKCHSFPVFEVAVTATATAIPVVTAVTTVTATETPKTPGFGIVATMVGLFACSLLVKRTNK
jgi:hypothetical protein